MVYSSGSIQKTAGVCAICRSSYFHKTAAIDVFSNKRCDETAVVPSIRTAADE